MVTLHLTTVGIHSYVVQVESGGLLWGKGHLERSLLCPSTLEGLGQLVVYGQLSLSRSAVSCHSFECIQKRKH